MLTARQASALTLLLTGLTEGEVTKQLGTSRQTVAQRIQRAKINLGAKTLCELGYLCGLALMKAGRDSATMVEAAAQVRRDL